MSTALSIITRAFTKAGIRPAETPLSAAELEDGLEELNDLIATWSAVGLVKGIAPTHDSNTDLQEERHVRVALLNSLAVLICAAYAKPVSPSLAKIESEAYSNLIASSWNLDTEYPDTLPVGSGNDEEWFDDDFFEQNSKDNF